MYDLHSMRIAYLSVNMNLIPRHIRIVGRAARAPSASFVRSPVAAGADRGSSPAVGTLDCLQASLEDSIHFRLKKQSKQMLGYAVGSLGGLLKVL
jgi:hypothetical protein